ncbi:GntR family transcriptional regulator [Neobacillus sp. MER 74]|uniref:GntR family transcriptional regulator n=1 Tax=Bacillaceae TaxID=186817 RepID=UPI000BF8B09F|nr:MULTISPECIES: GntR family transcriptional regulator [Bacillaceae]MCM3117241.1 GntR family transcriptional regulator [Neobacillus sp. MER 74]PFP28622.1 GntR family transcriptional regulator [Bacillus sp. AFS073361]
MVNNTVNAKEFAYEEIKAEILRLKLIPGTKISEKTMSDRLNVSRTPIREAFLKLAQEELLTIIPQSGTFVSLINLELAEEARFVREVIETNIVGLCCEHVSEESAFNLEVNLKMQEHLVSNHIEKQQIEKFTNLDENFHKELFIACGKERTWRMIQNMAGHLNRFRMLRIIDTKNLDWDLLLAHHKEIYQAISEKNKEKAEALMKEHLRLMLSEKDILLQAFPEYFYTQE